MNAKTIFSQALLHNLSLAAVAATLSLSAVACGAAPDGGPSPELASTGTNGDLVGDAGAGGDSAPNSLWIPATPDQPDPTPFLGGTGGSGSGSGGGGGGDRPRPQRRQ